MTEKERALIEKTSRYEFDSRIGIESKIEQEISKAKGTKCKRRKLSAKRTAIKRVVEETTYLRRLYLEVYAGEKLVEFVVYGTYLLTRDGTLHRIIDKVPHKNKLPLVVTTDDFLEITKIGGYRSVENMQASYEVPESMRKIMAE